MTPKEIAAAVAASRAAQGLPPTIRDGRLLDLAGDVLRTSEDDGRAAAA